MPPYFLEQRKIFQVVFRHTVFICTDILGTIGFSYHMHICFWCSLLHIEISNIGFDKSNHIRHRIFRITFRLYSNNFTIIFITSNTNYSYTTNSHIYLLFMETATNQYQYLTKCGTIIFANICAAHFCRKGSGLLKLLPFLLLIYCVLI